MFRAWVMLACSASSALVAADCTFLANPNAFLERQSRAIQAVHQRVITAAPAASAHSKLRAAQASELPARSFIDEEIFGRLADANVPSARLTTDEEFIRRITWDLTGRPPLPADIRAFVADSSPTKRDDLIDKLIGSAAFIDKWVMWLGDLLENVNYPALFDRREDGRNAYNYFMRQAISNNWSFRDVVSLLITATGNHYDKETGATNFPITGKTNMGPAQDTYDEALVKAATFFLGMSQYDCLLCHNGRGHLDQINLWGSQRSRLDAWKMAAHFARLNMPNRNVPASDFYYFSYDVSDRPSGTYDLNTAGGNRPERAPIATLKNLTPEYFGTGAVPKDGNWRKAFAASVWQDPMFATNFANRIWREMFGMGLVEPYDMLDPDRLDPDNPPPDPWTLQATHPVLLKKLAQSFADSDFNLRDLIRLIVQSNAYQMSSTYDAPWKLDYVTLFARHYPRRLMAEEIHDSITLSTGMMGNYPIVRAPTVQLAMQFPDPGEPHTDGNTGNFLNILLRGNRDSQPRSQNLSILQRLNIMNDPFVLNRVRITSPGLAAIGKISDNNSAVEELFLLFLARHPSDSESQNAVKYLSAAQNANDRNTYIEDLAWALINKAEFFFSY